MNLSPNIFSQENISFANKNEPLKAYIRASIWVEYFETVQSFHW